MSRSEIRRVLIFFADKARKSRRDEMFIEGRSLIELSEPIHGRKKCVSLLKELSFSKLLTFYKHLAATRLVPVGP